ncbi:MAG: enoyl-CoA hydratase/isomerase family protein [Alphaproteobacteria bacterium]|nr:enoyl-CoA hydratase/isomerase family protein [Alphaproteobacteria bacterium]
MAKIEIERRDAIAIVRFNNPPKGYMNAEMVGELGAAVEALLTDCGVRVLVFTGALRGVFIEHYDVAELVALSERLRAKGASFSLDRLSPEGAYHKILARLEGSPKPVIAAINGTAMGGGFEFAMACDIRLAERGPLQLGQPEINIGILAGAGGTQRLVRLVGEARALELSLTGRTVSPDEAAAIGMVHAAVDAPVLDHALAMAKRLAKQPPKAVAHIKCLVRGAADMPLSLGLAHERTLFMDLAVSDDGHRLMREFIDGKRTIRD